MKKDDISTTAEFAEVAALAAAAEPRAKAVHAE